MGPPSDASGNTTDVSCASSLETAAVPQWVCEHRDPAVARMVGFRRTVAGTPITRWWDNGANAIAFSRGDRGFVAINRESAPIAASVGKDLAPGTYCDILSGARAGAGCTGMSVVVANGGMVALTLTPNMAIAIDVATKL